MLRSESWWRPVPDQDEQPMWGHSILSTIGGLIYHVCHDFRPPRQHERRIPPPLGGRARGRGRGQPCLVPTKMVLIIRARACDFLSVAAVRRAGSSATPGPAENGKQPGWRATMPPRSIEPTPTSTPFPPLTSIDAALNGSGGDADCRPEPPPMTRSPVAGPVGGPCVAHLSQGRASLPEDARQSACGATLRAPPRSVFAGVDVASLSDVVAAGTLGRAST